MQSGYTNIGKKEPFVETPEATTGVVLDVFGTSYARSIYVLCPGCNQPSVMELLKFVNYFRKNYNIDAWQGCKNVPAAATKSNKFLS